ncbi:MAG: NifU N-terminal domain-containing protein [Planctomycetota bacterium]
MPAKIIRYDPTPNPNALKCIVDAPLSDRPRSFRTREAAAGDPLGEALFGVEGVTNVLINGAWFTVNKAPDAKWPTLKPGIERALEGNS